MTAGIDPIASNILNGMRFSNDPAITRYNELKRADGGASLSTDEMAAVASYLLEKTSLRYREVGGENQIAVVEKGALIKLKQPAFTKPDTTVEPLFPVMNWSFTDVGQAVGPNIHGPVIFIGDQFERTRVRVDGNYFVENEFRNCMLFTRSGFLTARDMKKSS